jgi:ATP-dependent helicase HrpA
MRGQLAGLVCPGFVSATGLERLPNLPRYLAGITQRLQALPTNPGRDRAWQTQVETAVALYADAGGRIPPAPGAPANLVHARWMLEEFRVSLFAQSLGTAETVSLQRIRKALTG